MPYNDLLTSISERYPCRDSQLSQLSALIGDETSPSPSSFVLYGLEATGKTLILRALLQESEVSFSWLPCDECITARHLTERIAATVEAALDLGEDLGLPRSQEVGALAVFLQAALARVREVKHFLVLDRIDQQRDPTPTLVPALRRMGEMIPNLTVIFVVSAPHSRFFSSAEIPHIHFPPYSREESIEILSTNPLPIKKTGEEQDPDDDETSDDEATKEELAKEELYVWQKFCATVWDSLAKGAARDIVRFRNAVEKNWSTFVQPIARGEYGTRNYSSLYLYHKDMFRQETSVLDTVIPPAVNERSTMVVKSHDLPYYSKFLLCAAYLASYNPPRSDALLFTKAGEGKKRKRGGGLNKQAGTRKIQRRLLGPQSFPIERLSAIFPTLTSHTVPPSVDVQAQIATLTSLRLLVKATSLDPLDGSAKWKVNVGWEYIRSIARSVKFDIEDYMIE
ncbi:origin recognition complex subunit 5 C-terminus-domain-containing protein [Tricharina praecox]|uniref:origin recognition complex subunit 5 C-terminus-domain-containing protein n=1 Tax=Tricharina praecox TaxID=43433 RepID=UPI00221F73F2|nr:origin recognition complex subunit 5 C-terminus-domain-containing protein [Tricharina praecox]KAI5852322.1 origin recognition complex subunit 5 C-terminus-domain-containing protein [Tricharina praecox]